MIILIFLIINLINEFLLYERLFIEFEDNRIDRYKIVNFKLLFYC